MSNFDRHRGRSFACLTFIDTEEGHLLIENFVNIFFVTPLSVSLHNLLDFYIYIYISEHFVIKKCMGRWLLENLQSRVESSDLFEVQKTQYSCNFLYD